MTEYEKMQGGMIYDCLTKELGEVQKHSHRLCEQYNQLGVDDAEKKETILHQLFPSDDFGNFRCMETPIFIDNHREIKIISHANHHTDQNPTNAVLYLRALCGSPHT